MKKQFIFTLTLVVASLTLSSAGIAAQASEVTALSENVESQIKIESVSADYYDFNNQNEYSGQAKLGDTINFSVNASGGIGQLTYNYHITKNAPGPTDDTGILTSSDFAWTPPIASSYNVTLTIYDEAGNTAQTSFIYLISK